MARTKRARAATTGSGFRQVVAAVDFSSGSSVALRRVLSLPLGRGATVHLVHVIPVPTLTPLAVAQEMAGEELRRLIAQAKGRSKRVRLSCETTSGRPADEIVRIARQRRADLIVSGRRGAGGFHRLLLGSTAERLARLSPVPVLLVSEASTTYRRVLLPVEVTDNVEPMLRATRQLLPTTTQLEVLHVYSAFGEGYLRYGRASESTIAAHRTMAREQAQEALEPIVRSLEAAGYRTTATLLNGDPRRVIPRVIQARRPDLIVLGNHGRTALGRALLGAAGREVLASAQRDVLLVPIA